MTRTFQCLVGTIILARRGVLDRKLVLQFKSLRRLPTGVRGTGGGRAIRLAAVVVLLVQVDLPRDFGKNSEGGPIALDHGQVHRRSVSLGVDMRLGLGLGLGLSLLLALETLRRMAHARQSQEGVDAFRLGYGWTFSCKVSFATRSIFVVILFPLEDRNHTRQTVEPAARKVLAASVVDKDLVSYGRGIVRTGVNGKGCQRFAERAGSEKDAKGKRKGNSPETSVRVSIARVL